jgi:hypothetical protein
VAHIARQFAPFAGRELAAAKIDEEVVDGDWDG